MTAILFDNGFILFEFRFENSYLNSDFCLSIYSLDFNFILCFNSQKTNFQTGWSALLSLPRQSFFLIQQFTMPQRKSKRATTYHQCPNTLSALDIHTMMSYQCFQALSASSLVRSRCMLMLSMLMDDNDNDDNLLLLLYHRHLSNLCKDLFFFALDSEFITIEPDQVIPRFAPASRNQTFNLIEDGWCYHHTRFTVTQLSELYLCLQLPVMFTVSTSGHKASSEEAFIITTTKNLLLVGPTPV